MSLLCRLGLHAYAERTAVWQMEHCRLLIDGIRQCSRCRKVHARDAAQIWENECLALSVGLPLPAVAITDRT